ncbi:MAG: undecaprenyldiphospho-muramoylpentapeptide beta-N-acetylglucosaminyltransferase [Halioglobus sp.]|nr:undecaprenyldiphospho-muramoylpentapeptide beta-N-acetylglucosaminyltransferase [Halioglobus sp.]
MAPLVLIMAGGTGGHVYPALAVAAELLARGYRVEWVGTRRGLEHRVVPAADIPLHFLSVRGVRGKGLLDKLLAVFFLGLSAVQALWLVLRRAPACVVGMGGYVAGPAGVAAWITRRPLLIHEQNAVAGTTNRMLAPLADTIACGFEGAFAGREGCRVVGNPVRAELVAQGRGNQWYFDGKRPLRLLVLGGSLGAQAINDVMPAALALCVDDAVGQMQVRHQTGAGHDEAVRQAYVAEGLKGVEVAPFIEDMAGAYSWADLVLCRAGALTVAELAVMGRPAILVPLPHAIDDHQSANARSLAEVGGALLLPQEEMTAEVLAALFKRYQSQPKTLAAKAIAVRRAATPRAAADVADLCEELLHA